MKYNEYYSRIVFTLSNLKYCSAEFQLQKLRDEFRRWICGQRHIILIEFPYNVDERMRHPKKIQRFIINELKNKLKIRFDNIPLFNHKFFI